jgi:hypothetical protein
LREQRVLTANGDEAALIGCVESLVVAPVEYIGVCCEWRCPGLSPEVGTSSQVETTQEARLGLQEEASLSLGVPIVDITACVLGELAVRWRQRRCRLWIIDDICDRAPLVECRGAVDRVRAVDPGPKSLDAMAVEFDTGSVNSPDSTPPTSSPKLLSLEGL